METGLIVWVEPNAVGERQVVICELDSYPSTMPKACTSLLTDFHIPSDVVTDR